jgi:hypothetical protein
VSQQFAMAFGARLSASALIGVPRAGEMIPAQANVVSAIQDSAWAHGEEAPIGLILCAGADTEQMELLQLDAKSIRVAEYLTELPSPEVLRERLHRALASARERAVLSMREGDDT